MTQKIDNLFYLCFVWDYVRTTNNQQPTIKNEEKIQVPIRNPFLEQLGKVYKPEIGIPKQGTNGGQM